MDSNADINVIWTYISFLRKKLKEINSQVQIHTIRGAGYSLEKHKRKKAGNDETS